MYSFLLTVSLKILLPAKYAGWLFLAEAVTCDSSLRYSAATFRLSSFFVKDEVTECLFPTFWLLFELKEVYLIDFFFFDTLEYWGRPLFIEVFRLFLTDYGAASWFKDY